MGKSIGFLQIRHKFWDVKKCFVSIYFAIKPGWSKSYTFTNVLWDWDEYFHKNEAAVMMFSVNDLWEYNKQCECLASSSSSLTDWAVVLASIPITLRHPSLICLQTPSSWEMQTNQTDEMLKIIWISIFLWFREMIYLEWNLVFKRTTLWINLIIFKSSKCIFKIGGK